MFSLWGFEYRKKNTLGIIACHISAAINPTHWWTFKDFAVLFVSVKTLGRIHPAQLVNLDIVPQFQYLAKLSLKCLIVREVKEMPCKAFRRIFWKFFHLISKHNAKQGRSPSKGPSETLLLYKPRLWLHRQYCHFKGVRSQHLSPS